MRRQKVGSDSRAVRAAGIEWSGPPLHRLNSRLAFDAEVHVGGRYFASDDIRYDAQESEAACGKGSVPTRSLGNGIDRTNNE
jgi:hypothetical protein